ncbi:Ubx Domain-Containing Protein 7 [Manis pentadactyla]|nr:Ubx Domain-Containing Protein 7 [Manis pentadactyla]
MTILQTRKRNQNKPSGPGRKLGHYGFSAAQKPKTWRKLQLWHLQAIINSLADFKGPLGLHVDGIPMIQPHVRLDSGE